MTPLSLFWSSCGVLNLIFEALVQSYLYSRFVPFHVPPDPSHRFSVALKYVTDRDDFKAMSSSPVNSPAHHLSSYCCLRETGGAAPLPHSPMSLVCVFYGVVDNQNLEKQLIQYANYH